VKDDAVDENDDEQSDEWQDCVSTSFFSSRSRLILFHLY